MPCQYCHIARLSPSLLFTATAREVDMSIRMIYHTDESTAGGISPFDEALMTMTSEQDILIACPYLDIGFLNRYIGHSRSWYLLTDVQAWLNAYPSTKHEEIQTFIEEH